MAYNSKELWQSFKNSLESNLKTSKNELIEAWKSNPNRTNFYKEILIPKISKELHIEPDEKEYLLIDKILCKRGPNKYKVPVVYCEFENVVNDDESEIWKLCSINAPLKVVFYCSSEEMKFFEEDWIDYVVEDYAEVIGLVGYFAVIVADYFNNKFRYRYFAYDQTGKVVEAGSIEIEV